MTKVVFFNSIHTDGKGDFGHLTNILTALKKMPTLQNFQFYAVVDCTLWPKEDFEGQLKALNIDGYFLGRSDDQLWENPELQKHLSEAVQIIQVSRQSFPLKKYLPYINPNALFKFIGEHEEIDPFMLTKIDLHGKRKNFILRPMGLSPGTFGIKLQDRRNQITQDPFAILQSQDPQFYHALLATTQSPNMEYFKHNHFFVPAYYSNMGPFCKLLLLFIINHKLPQDRNIAIFLSGKSNLIKEDLQDLFSDETYKNIVTTVKRVVLIQAQGDPIIVYLLNPSGTRSIEVFSGFKLSDAGFDAAFDAASFIAGVSGDNTFERTVSTKLLPFYWSTNENLKKRTMIALANIVQERLATMNVAEETKKDLLTFFNYDNFSRFISFFRSKKEELAALYEFRDLDLIAMTKVWSEIAQYIIDHHNFYDRLLNIISEGLDPALFLINATLVPAAASSTGAYAYPQISQWHSKPQEVSSPSDKPILSETPTSLKNK